MRIAAVAPCSIDRVRLIRRGARCFAFGAIGLIPVVGAGLAVQALRLGDQLNQELGETRQTRAMCWYWLAGVALVWAADAYFGLSAVLLVCVVLLALQSAHVWRKGRPVAGQQWNPAHRHVRLGVAFACAGLGLSLWLLALVAHQLGTALGEMVGR